MRRVEDRPQRWPAATSFEAVAREWHEKKRHEWVDTYAAKVLTSANRICSRPLGAGRLLKSAPPNSWPPCARSKPRRLETLKRVRQRANDIFLHAIATGSAENNPAAGLHKAVKTAPVEHRPALHPSDFASSSSALDAVRVSKMVKNAVLLQVLTFLRPGELRGARWARSTCRPRRVSGGAGGA